MSVERLREVTRRMKEVKEERRRLLQELRELRNEAASLRAQGFRLRRRGNEDPSRKVKRDARALFRTLLASGRAEDVVARLKELV